MKLDAATSFPNGGGLVMALRLAYLAHDWELDSSIPTMGLHHLESGSTGPGHSLLRSDLQEEKIKNDTFFIRDKFCHLTLCLRLMEYH